MRGGLLLLSVPLLQVPAYGYARSVTHWSAPLQTIGAVLGVLFPSGGSGLGAEAFNAQGYLAAVLEDRYVSVNVRRHIVEGATWLDEAAQRRYDTGFNAMGAEQQETLLREISARRWGDVWLWRIMGFAFEAMLGDPVYGANVQSVGWKWLEHEPGFPRPRRPFT